MNCTKYQLRCLETRSSFYGVLSAIIIQVGSVLCGTSVESNAPAKKDCRYSCCQAYYFPSKNHSKLESKSQTRSFNSQAAPSLEWSKIEALEYSVKQKNEDNSYTERFYHVRCMASLYQIYSQMVLKLEPDKNFGSGFKKYIFKRARMADCVIRARIAHCVMKAKLVIENITGLIIHLYKKKINIYIIPKNGEKIYVTNDSFLFHPILEFFILSFGKLKDSLRQEIESSKVPAKKNEESIPEVFDKFVEEQKDLDLLSMDMSDTTTKENVRKKLINMHDVRFVPLIFNIDKVSGWFNLAEWEDLIEQSWKKNDNKELVVFRQIFFGLVLTKVKRNSMSEETKQISGSLIGIFQKCRENTNKASLIQEVEDIYKNNEAFINTKQDHNLTCKLRYEQKVIKNIIILLKSDSSIQDIYKCVDPLIDELSEQIINSSYVADFITNYIDFDYHLCFSIKELENQVFKKVNAEKEFKGIAFVNSNIKLNVFIMDFIFSCQRITNTPLLQNPPPLLLQLLFPNPPGKAQEQEIEQLLKFTPRSHQTDKQISCYQHTYGFIYYSLIIAHLEKFDYSHLLVEDNDKQMSVANSNTPHTSEENPYVQEETTGSNSNNNTSSPTKKRRIQ